MKPNLKRSFDPLQASPRYGPKERPSEPQKADQAGLAFSVPFPSP
jgi:hypothetical protein